MLFALSFMWNSLKPAIKVTCEMLMVVMDVLSRLSHPQIYKLREWNEHCDYTDCSMIVMNILFRLKYLRSNKFWDHTKCSTFLMMHLGASDLARWYLHILQCWYRIHNWLSFRAERQHVWRWSSTLNYAEMCDKSLKVLKSEKHFCDYMWADPTDFTSHIWRSGASSVSILPAESGRGLCDMQQKFESPEIGKEL